MSAPIASFVDHYQMLGVEPKADSATIHAAYTALALKYKQEGDKEKYAAVTASYELLADPESKKAFDAVRLGDGGDEAPLAFDVDDFFFRLHQDANRRLCLMCLLYNRRRLTPRTPGLPIRMLEKVIKLTLEELTIDMWFLKEKGFITADDKSALMISVAGIEFLEREPPSAEQIAPFLVQNAEPAAPEAPAVAKPAPPKINVPPRTGEPFKINIPKAFSRPKAPPAH